VDWCVGEAFNSLLRDQLLWRGSCVVLQTKSGPFNSLLRDQTSPYAHKVMRADADLSIPSCGISEIDPSLLPLIKEKIFQFPLAGSVGRTPLDCDTLPLHIFQFPLAGSEQKKE